jgi:hypothetical protein
MQTIRALYIGPKTKTLNWEDTYVLQVLGMTVLHEGDGLYYKYNSLEHFFENWIVTGSQR